MRVTPGTLGEVVRMEESATVSRVLEGGRPTRTRAPESMVGKTLFM